MSGGVPRTLTVSELCEEPGVTRVTLYRYIGPDGKLREHGKRVLSQKYLQPNVENNVFE